MLSKYELIQSPGQPSEDGAGILHNGGSKR